MSFHSEFLRRWPLSAAVFFALALAPSLAGAVSARDQAAAEALNQRMAAAEKRYQEALVLTANGDPKGVEQGDAALEDMEDVIDACIQQRGCEVNTQLAAFKRLLKTRIDQSAADADGVDDDDESDPLDDGSDHAAAAVAGQPQPVGTLAVLNDKRHAFDNMVAYNPAIQAGIRRWLTDMRGSLVSSYENYQNMRAELYPPWERRGLPEALLFGIMAKESNGRVHSNSRVGAAGPMQFMPATGRRYGLGPDGTGFDTRFDPNSAGMASAEYIGERLGELGNSVELALAAYNGGEGRALRVYGQYPGRSFWDVDVYDQFPAETRDYVPMVIAAAWLFLHPKQYGLEFPRIATQPTSFQLARQSSIYELTICLGNGDTREGYMRTLRNLNPRYQPDQWLPAGTVMKGNARLVSLYNRFCVSGPRADLARTLVNANVGAALTRTAYPAGTVAVGAATPLPAALPSARESAREPSPARKAAPAAKTYRVARGDTLGKIAQKHACDLRQLARANGLRAPGYTVKPGQAIKLESCRK